MSGERRPDYYHRYLCGCVAMVYVMEDFGRLYEVTVWCRAHEQRERAS